MKPLTIAAAVALVGVQLLSAPRAKAQPGWSLTGDKGTAAGKNFIGTTDRQPFEIKVNGRRVMRFEPAVKNADGDFSPNVIGGDGVNSVKRGVQGATICGGGGSPISPNIVRADFGTIGGGLFNEANGKSSSVVGGVNNVANGAQSMVAGGLGNTAGGTFSFAAGRFAQAAHDGAFVWADSNDFAFSSSATNEFDARATGGVNFVSAVDGSGNETAGVSLAPGGGSWGSISDRDLKENFATVDVGELLEGLARMPIRTWNYKAQAKSIRHIGPTAQDFRAAFKVGEDNRHITAVDADGVALAAIQGLYKMLQDKDAELRALRAQQAVMAAQIEEVSVLKARLDSLERQADLIQVSNTAGPAHQPR